MNNPPILGWFSFIICLAIYKNTRYRNKIDFLDGNFFLSKKVGPDRMRPKQQLLDLSIYFTRSGTKLPKKRVH